MPWCTPGSKFCVADLSVEPHPSRPGTGLGAPWARHYPPILGMDTQLVPKKGGRKMESVDSPKAPLPTPKDYHTRASEFSVSSENRPVVEGPRNKAAALGRLCLAGRGVCGAPCTIQRWPSWRSLTLRQFSPALRWRVRSPEETESGPSRPYRFV